MLERLSKSRAKQKYYVVWKGHTPGIYTSWDECQAQIKHFPQAKFKSFPTMQEAQQAYQEGWDATPKGQPMKSFENEIDWDSISVDVGTRGNPGPVEYKGVDTRTGKELFSHGPIAKGTNNLGEFLAIVHALAYLNQQGSTRTVYSDSLNAINWVKQKKVRTSLARDASTAEIWNLIDRAERWLATHHYENKLLKWDTKRWGEIKADYGRK